MHVPRRRGLALAACAVLLSACWEMPGQGPDRRAHNPFEETITTETVASLAEAWTVEPGGTGDVRTPVVSGDGVHVAGWDADQNVVLMTVQPDTGAVKWTTPFDVAGVGTGSNPVVVGDNVYFGWGFGNLGGHWTMAGFDTATGQRGPDRTPGLVDTARNGNLGVYLYGFGSGGPCAGIVGVDDLDDPTASWTGTISVEQSSCAAVPPTLGESAMYHSGKGPNWLQGGSTTFGNGIRSFTITQPANCNPSGGSPFVPCPTWVTPLPGSSSTSPVISEDGETLFTVNDAGTVYAVDAATGAIEWSATLGSAVADPPALAEGSLFVPTAGGLKVLSAGGCGSPTCAPVWSAAAGVLSVQPAVAGGVVFTGAQNGDVKAYPAAGCGAATCSSLWSEATGSAITGGPSVTGGRLFVGTADGRLIAYTPDGE